MADKILVFIPMYNCAPQIPRALAQFVPELAGLFQEILIVDNRSTDGGLIAAQAAATKLANYNVTIIQNNDNVNLGGSHKVAFNYAINNGFDYVVIMHGDDQGRIMDVVPQLRVGEHHKYDYLLGARFMKGSSLPGYSLMRIAGNVVFNTLFSIITLRKLNDLGAGLNVFSVKTLSQKYYLKFPDRLTFNYYLLLHACAFGLKFKYFPHQWSELDQISNVKMLRQVKELFKILGKWLTQGKRMFAELPPPEHAYDYTVIAQHRNMREAA